MKVRRTPDEWVFIASTYRDVKHIFLEGPVDIRLISSRICDARNIDIHSTDDVSIDLNPPYNPFSSGNRERLLRFACFLRQAGSIDNIVVFIDRDFDCWTTSLGSSSSPVVLSDYANLFAGEMTVSWLNNISLRAYGLSISCEVWESFLEILAFGFAARYTALRTAISKKAPVIGDYISLHGETINFDAALYVQHYFDIPKKSPRNADNVEFIVQMSKFNISDYRSVINTSDLFSLYHSLLRAHKKIPPAAPQQTTIAALLAGIFFVATDTPNLAELLEWAIS